MANDRIVYYVQKQRDGLTYVPASEFRGSDMIACDDDDETR